MKNIILISLIFSLQACNKNEKKDEVKIATPAIVEKESPAIVENAKPTTDKAIMLNPNRKVDANAVDLSNENKNKTGKVVSNTPKEKKRVNAPAPAVKKKKTWSNKKKGVMIGATSGAVAGAIVSKKKVKGAIVGGVVGAGVGLATGVILDNKEKKDN